MKKFILYNHMNMNKIQDKSKNCSLHGEYRVYIFFSLTYNNSQCSPLTWGVGGFFSSRSNFMDTVPITPDGYKKLKDELSRLLKVERPANVRAIEEARAHGDLSENAEYHAAKERQAFIEGRIQELQGQMGQCEIMEIKGPYERAMFGATVTVEDVNTGDEKTFTLVGPYESQPENGRISVATPLGKALIGKEEGDEITVRVPKGIQELVITEIQ